MSTNTEKALADIAAAVQELRNIASSMNEFTQEIRELKQLLSDTVLYPSDPTQPARFLIGTAGAVEIIDLG